MKTMLHVFGTIFPLLYWTSSIIGTTTVAVGMFLGSIFNHNGD